MSLLIQTQFQVAIFLVMHSDINKVDGLPFASVTSELFYHLKKNRSTILTSSEPVVLHVLLLQLTNTTTTNTATTTITTNYN